MRRIRTDAAVDIAYSTAAFEERIVGIEKATTAMLEAGVDDDTIIKMLQKHWDLRLSEATAFIENSKQSD